MPDVRWKRPVRVHLERASLDHEADFLAAVRCSRRLHRPWVKAPGSAEKFRKYIERQDGMTNIAYFAFSDDDELVGVVNVSEIVRGPFQSAYLSYYGFAPHQKLGYMTVALTAIVSTSFWKHGLHRLEVTAGAPVPSKASVRVFQDWRSLVRRVAMNVNSTLRQL